MERKENHEESMETYFIPVLAMALCLSLAACGNSDDVARGTTGG